MKEIEYWIWFARIQGLRNCLKQQLLDNYQTPQNIWHLSKQQLLKVKGMNEIIANQILDKTYRKDLASYCQYMQAYQIQILTQQDKDYPVLLKSIYDAPVMLFLRGNRKILNNTMIGIIGCRNATSYGQKIANQLAYQLAKEKIGIISGMAKGIDACAHWGCLQAKGKTIAVLGSGLDRIYPKENTRLYQAILEQNGAIVSEYLIGTPPNKMNFPARNRIVSGMSKGIIVVEARQKSGTLITVDFALEQGRDVFVVPRKY